MIRLALEHLLFVKSCEQETHMTIYQFTHTQLDYNIGDTPGVVQFFCVADDLIEAEHKFDAFSQTPYDNCWAYEQGMDEQTAKDAAWFVYYNQDVARDADELMVAVLETNPDIVTPTWIYEAAQYDTPNALKKMLEIFPDAVVDKRCLYASVIRHYYHNICILIESGRVRDDGSVLATACEMGTREVFDMVLPISDPQAAWQYAPKNNLQWLDDILAQRQKESLLNHIAPSVVSRTRKL